MAALRRYIAAAMALAGVGAPAAADPARWQPFIQEAAARFSLPSAWIERVIAAESGGRTRLHGQPITSPKGAMGLMQLMPGTWSAMRARLRLGTDPHAPRDNILAGALYLRLVYERFGYPGLFAAYHAGPARYAEHLATGRRLPAETRRYLLLTARDHAPGAADRTSRAPIFVGGVRPEGGDSLPGPHAERGLFFALRTPAGSAPARR